IIALLFVIYILGRIYSIGIGILFGIAVFVLILFMMSKRVHKRLNTLESKFLNNLNERELRRSGRNNNIVSNLHQAYMTVGYGCPFVGERLQNSNLRHRFGVNICSILRGGDMQPLPGGDTRLFPGDVLGVIGTDEQIQALLPLVEADAPEKPTTEADNFKLTHIQLSDKSPLIGKTVAQSGLSNKYSSLLVSIMRDSEYITPESDTTFMPDDILWLVGNPKTLQTLK
ncbi:MAG: TrkA C-terminal domain-containing protein, partial [Paramuribaculum sp.]|nr:TrkA C-terminal domain-containing protein [Paramuribaculum sp.]